MPVFYLLAMCDCKVRLNFLDCDESYLEFDGHSIVDDIIGQCEVIGLNCENNILDCYIADDEVSKKVLEEYVYPNRVIKEISEEELPF